MVDSEGGNLHSGGDEEYGGVDNVGREHGVGRVAHVALSGVGHGEDLRERAVVNGELTDQRENDAGAEDASGWSRWGELLDGLDTSSEVEWSAGESIAQEIKVKYLGACYE